MQTIILNQRWDKQAEPRLARHLIFLSTSQVELTQSIKYSIQAKPNQVNTRKSSSLAHKSACLSQVCSEPVKAFFKVLSRPAVASFFLKKVLSVAAKINQLAIG